MMKDFSGQSIFMHLCAVLDSGGKAEALNFRNPWRNLRNEVPEHDERPQQ
jgi:hypothetical protein